MSENSLYKRSYIVIKTNVPVYKLKYGVPHIVKHFQTMILKLGHKLAKSIMNIFAFIDAG